MDRNNRIIYKQKRDKQTLTYARRERKIEYITIIIIKWKTKTNQILWVFECIARNCCMYSYWAFIKQNLNYINYKFNAIGFIYIDKNKSSFFQHISMEIYVGEWVLFSVRFVLHQDYFRFFLNNFQPSFF